jgi:hypothetical protein
VPEFLCNPGCHNPSILYEDFCWPQYASYCAEDTQFPRLRHLWVDGGYRGEDKGKDWVEKVLGWSVDLLERPRKAAPEEVLKSWAKE